MPCAGCAALVSAEDLAQGFAVRVGGRLLCPLCVDRLPGDAQVKVNQMRALRGMATRTYRVASPRHPGLVMFSFTTSALVLAHRRRQVHGETFETLPLPPPGSRPRLPSIAEASRGDRRGWLIAAAIGVAAIVVLAWLFAGSSRPTRRPHQAADPDPIIQPVVPVALPADPAPQTRSYAVRLTELENRLHQQPATAGEVRLAAERLRDEIPPREIALRNRADDLAHEAANRERPLPDPAPPPEQQKPPAEKPPLVAPPVKPVEQPVAKPPEKPPVAQAPAPPAEKPVEPAAKPPEQAAVKPVEAVAKPVEAVAKPPRADKPEIRTWRPASWPPLPRDPALVDPVRTADLPWPWPVGSQPDEGLLRAQPWKGSRKRMGLELAMTALGEGGGVVIALHPGRRDRKTLDAAWSDGTTPRPLPPVQFATPAWQTVVFPAPDPDLPRASLRLVLSDAEDLDRDDPFLVGPGTIVSGGPAPKAEDHPAGLPLATPDPTTAGGIAFYKAFRARVDEARKSHRNRFDPKAVGIAIAGISGPAIRSVKDALHERLAIPVVDGNPTELPIAMPELCDPAKPLPAKLEDEIAEDRWHALLFGSGEQAWGRPGEADSRVGGLLQKLQPAQPRGRQRSVLPVLVVGSCDNAKPDEQRIIDEQWNPTLLAACATAGVPVIDLRPAQHEENATARRERAAVLLAEGWRQVTVLIARMKN